MATDLIIIGNGFDLNLGLKTSYADFINSPEYLPLLKKRNTIAQTLYNNYKAGDWLDIEKRLKEFSKSYTVTSQIENDFDELKEALTSYLNTIDISTMNEDSLAYKFLYNVITPNCKILDFNYTGTTKYIMKKKLFADLHLESCVIQVHGSLENNNIIFGVEDHADITLEHIFLKKSYNTNFQGFDINNFVNLKTRIHIFGHSLGETDTTYFKPFFQNIINNPIRPQEKNTVNLYFHGRPSWNSLMLQIDTMTDSRLNIFKQRVALEPHNTLG